MAPRHEEGENMVWPQALLGSDSSHSRIENLVVKTPMTGGSTGSAGKEETLPSESGCHSKDQPLPPPMKSKNKTICTTVKPLNTFCNPNRGKTPSLHHVNHFSTSLTHTHTTRRTAEAGYTGRQKGYKCDMMIIYYHLPNIHLSTPQCPLQRWSINLKPLTLVLATWLTLVNKVCVDMAHATLEQRTIGLPPSAMRRRLLFQPRCHNGRLVVQAQRPEWRANWNLMHRLGRTAKQSIDPWAKLKQLMFYLSHQDFECVCPYSKKLTNKRDHIIYCPRLRYF